MLRPRRIFRESPQARAAYDLMVEIEALVRLNIDKITIHQEWDARELLGKLESYLDMVSDEAERHSKSCKLMEEYSATYKDKLDNIRCKAFEIFDVEDKDKDS